MLPRVPGRRRTFRALIMRGFRLRPGRARPATANSNSQPSQDHLERTKPGEGGLQQIESDEPCKPKPIGVVIMRQDQAYQDEASGKSANDHFHRFSELIEAASHERPEDHAVKRARDGVACQRASPGRTTDQFVVGKTEPAADERAD